MTPSERSFALDTLNRVRDEWFERLQGDLENGVAWLNDEAARQLDLRYPNLASFGEFLNELEEEINEN